MAFFSLGVCLSLHGNSFSKDTSHIGLETPLVQYDVIFIQLVTSAMVLFPNKLTF